MKQILPNVIVIVIVWGYSVWQKFIDNSNDPELQEIYNDKAKIVLNKLKCKTKNGSYYGRKINRISDILDDKYDDLYCDEGKINSADSLSKLKEIFKAEKN